MKSQGKNPGGHTKTNGQTGAPPFVEVVSTPAIRRGYHRLLASDWKRTTVEETLELLWQEVRDSAGRLSFQEVLRPDRNGLPHSGLNEQVTAEIRAFRQHFQGGGSIPEVPETSSAHKGGRLAARAEAAWTYLVLGNLAKLSGETGLLADSQSLLFLVAVEFLLPGLERARLEVCRRYLVNALYMHTFITWGQDPQRQAHHFFLQGVLMDYLQRPDLRRENLFYSVSLTHLEDHSFLTKVQAYVFSLLDSAREAEARNFLMRLYRHSPESYLEELQEMLDTVQEHSVAKTG
jgi:hypothetical protein